MESIRKIPTTLLNFFPLSLQEIITKGRLSDEAILKLYSFESVIDKMPKTYETEDQKDPVVFLHYFIGESFHWFITEKDKGAEDDLINGRIPGEQLQAFGLVITPDCPYGEMGYINIQEILSYDPVIIDPRWKPCPLSQVKRKFGC